MIAIEPIVIPAPTNEEEREHLARSLDRNLLIMSAVIAIMATGVVIALLGMSIGIGVAAAVFTVTAACARLMDRFDFDMSTVLIAVMTSIMLLGAAAAIWMVLAP